MIEDNYLDIREVPLEETTLIYLHQNFPKYQKHYERILVTDDQYDSISLQPKEYYERYGNYKLRGVPMVSPSHPYKKTCVICGHVDPEVDHKHVMG